MDSKPPYSSPIWGVDFSSAPSRRKPIWHAVGCWSGEQVQLQGLHALHSLQDFEALLRQPGPWVCGFDLPLGLPRVFVDAMAWGPGVLEMASSLRKAHPSRAEWRAAIDTWGNDRPQGQRLPHRRCDTALPGGARSTSPLQSRYVPVALMLFEGLPRLLDAGVSLPGQCRQDEQRIALEAYPGWLAQALIGRRSYKNQDDAERRAARADLLAALAVDAAGLGLRGAAPPALTQLMLDDPSGDPLDAWLCLLQAAWAWRQPRWGQPADVDPLEGWIVGAQSA